ncbi:MAG: 3-phosphoshikimate 1-carboxyvinyltransferase [Candidatus Omnitrophica bacterium]|nr:3-phosphoshikimate 1-carboxyvinyltransferase [Candidatus Omnitrophota bacterium]
MKSLVIPPSKTLQGRLIPPGDKSISHRAVMFGALAEGNSSFSHFLEAEDCLHTMQAFQAMGVLMDYEKGKGKITIHGVGLQGLKRPSAEINLGNSGTSMRLLLGILAGQKLEVVLSGDPSLSKRPMKRVTQPLKKMGAQIKGSADANFSPLTIRGGNLRAIEYDNVLASAQVKSAILLAGLQAEGTTRVIEKLPSRDHTERFLYACGAEFKKEGNVLHIEKTERLKAVSGEIPGDMSAAAFFIVGAAMAPGSSLEVENVCLNPTRTGFLNVLKRMGAFLEIHMTQELPEPMGTIRVEGRRLNGTRVAPEEIPSLIDELPILMIAMALAEGESLVSGAQELRVKESDRIQSMVQNLKAVGANAEELADGCLIRGVSHFQGSRIQTHWDHRTAMSFSIASLMTQGDMIIDDVTCVATSFPSFFEEFERLKKNR